MMEISSNGHPFRPKQDHPSLSSNPLSLSNKENGKRGSVRDMSAIVVSHLPRCQTEQRTMVRVSKTSRHTI